MATYEQFLEGLETARAEAAKEAVETKEQDDPKEEKKE